MDPMAENVEVRLQPLPTIPGERGDVRLEERLQRAIPIMEQVDRLRGWRARLAPRFRRIGSAGQLLFQVVGVAGYAGYFASMHTLMRFVSGGLMAGAWYAIYRIRSRQPSVVSHQVSQPSAIR